MMRVICNDAVNRCRVTVNIKRLGLARVIVVYQNSPAFDDILIMDTGDRIFELGLILSVAFFRDKAGYAVGEPSERCLV